jgi:ADP-ribosylglycohydrolase
MLDMLDRASGVLLGTALGDAFGAPFEGASTGAVAAAIQERAIAVIAFCDAGSGAGVVHGLRRSAASS